MRVWGVRARARARVCVLLRVSVSGASLRGYADVQVQANRPRRAGRVGGVSSDEVEVLAATGAGPRAWWDIGLWRRRPGLRIATGDPREKLNERKLRPPRGCKGGCFVRG